MAQFAGGEIQVALAPLGTRYAGWRGVAVNSGWNALDAHATQRTHARTEGSEQSFMLNSDF